MWKQFHINLKGNRVIITVLTIMAVALNILVKPLMRICIEGYSGILDLRLKQAEIAFLMALMAEEMMRADALE